MISYEVEVFTSNGEIKRTAGSYEESIKTLDRMIKELEDENIAIATITTTQRNTSGLIERQTIQYFYEW